MKEYTIGITTFPRRLEQFKQLVLSIRQHTNNEILVQANPFNKITDETYRREMLEYCSNVDNLYLTIYPTFTSLSKMWNTIVINSSNDNILVLNDDVRIESNVYESVGHIIDVYNGLSVLNHSWSHYIISKRMLDTLGYFDERLLAYGEEDGDMVWRYNELFKSPPPLQYISGIVNLQEGYGLTPPNLRWFDAGHVIRPAFNREFCLGIKYTPNPNSISGMFGSGHQCNIANEKQYPYEKFKLDNKDLL